MQGRLHRRLTLLRGKRALRVPPARFAADQAGTRLRAERRVRTWLRQGRAVVLLTPRWSAATRFLDDVALDLAVSEPKVTARLLSVAPLAGRPLHEAWGWLLKALTEFLGVDLGGTASQAVSRQGFREVVGRVLDRAAGGDRRALLVHGAEHLPMEVRDDFLRAFEEHADRAGATRRFTPLLATAIDGPSFEVAGGAHLVLPDYSPREAVDALAEYLGAAEPERLERVVEWVGGVPALIERVGAEAERNNRLNGDRDAVWRALGPLGEELRGAVSIADGVAGLPERIDALAKGPGPVDEQIDGFLLRAGLVERRPNACVALRAPLFAEVPGAR